MSLPQAAQRNPAPALTLIAAAALSVLLSACGGGGGHTPVGGDDEAPASPSSLSGTVAVGAPMADARVRILDAAGTVVATDVAVDAQGVFSGVPLTGTGPFRIEACGHAGGNYRCVYSVAQGAGVANVTPLTSAAVLLAAGQTPEALMTGDGSALNATALQTAQNTLRQALSAVLADAGVASDFDFISGTLAAGSRTGYDRVLDAVGVTTGESDAAFVQITPRLGTGNLYLEAGAAPQGTLTVDSGAGDISLSGIETLFAGMSQAMVSQQACTTGLAGHIATSASMAMGDSPVTGRDDVAGMMCQFIGSPGSGGEEGGPGWGVTFVSPTLGRCDLSGADPVCRVSFVLRLADGSQQSIGEEMAVVRESGAWKFKGNINPIAIHANATVQRTQVFDHEGALAYTGYDRAFQFDVQAYSGLQCARVAQKNAAGQDVVIAYFKRFGGGVPRLSAWRDSMGNVLTNPTAPGGQLRDADDTWIQLPEGTAGDDVIQNFYRGGRTLTVSLYSDTACASALAIDGKSVFEVDMMGVPPLASRLQSFPWPTLTTASITNLRTLSLGANSTGTLQAAWTFARGHTGLGQATVCSDRQCGDGSGSRIGDVDFSSAAQSVSVPVGTQSQPLAADGFKMLALYGRTGEGMGVQVNTVYCPGTVGSWGECN